MWLAFWTSVGYSRQQDPGPDEGGSQEKGSGVSVGTAFIFIEHHPYNKFEGVNSTLFQLIKTKTKYKP